MHHKYSPKLRQYIRDDTPEGLPKSGLLYHYTTMDSFLNIVNSTSIRITDIQYLNDSSEHKHGCKVILDFLDSIEEPKQSHELLKEYLNKTIGNYLNLGHVFVFSMSKKPNKLSQWRAYAGNGGVSFGLNVKHLYAACRRFSFRILKCHYGDSGKDEIKKLLREAFQIWTTELDDRLNHPTSSGETFFSEFGKDIELIIGTLAVSFKHRAFKEEDEWRMFNAIPQNERSPYYEYHKFRSRDGVLIPYFNFPIEKENKMIEEDNWKMQDLIKEIHIGPSKAYDLSLSSLEQFQKKMLPGVKIIPHEIPLIMHR